MTTPAGLRGYRVMTLPGDGVGPEIVAAARQVLDAAGRRYGYLLAYEEGVMGGCAIDAYGAPMEAGLIERCKACDAVLLGAVGGPKWDTTDPHKPRPEQGLLGMRKGLELFANLRPVKSFKALAHNSTLKPEVIDGVDMLVVRELTGGVYFGKSERTADTAYDTMIYSEAEVDRLVEYAFTVAEGRRRLLHSVDKANVLESSRLWRAVAIRVAERHPGVELRHMLVDNCAMQFIREPKQFDVIATENLFGDVLSDEAAMLTGSIGMLPSRQRRRRRREPLRADPRLGPRHRRQGAGESLRDGSQCRDDARPQLRRARRGTRRGEGRRDGPRERRPHGRHRRPGRDQAQHRRDDRRYPGRPGGRLTRRRGGTMPPIPEMDTIWMDGTLVPWADAKVHVLTHALHYGSGVFEGIRAYKTERGPAVLRLTEHLKRLARSAKLYYMPVPYGIEQLYDATFEVLESNKLDACYIRPLVFRGYGEMGLFPMNAPVQVIIAAWPWGTYLGEEGILHGVRAKTSSIQSLDHTALARAAKATGQYLNSILAKIEVLNAGYDEAIMLTEHGHVAEGSGENIFAVRGGVLMTPPPSDGVLEGITRDIRHERWREAMGIEVPGAQPCRAATS